MATFLWKRRKHRAACADNVPLLNELVLLFDSAKASAEASAAAAAAGGGGDRDGAAGGGGGRAKGKSQMSKAYGRAIESLALYPLQITSAEEALELVGVGDFLAARIGKILMQKLGIRPGDNMAPAAAMDAAPSAMAAAAAPAAKPPRKRKQSPAAAAAADSSAAAAASPIAAASSFHAVVAPLPSSLPSRNNSIPILAPMPTLPATAAAAVAPPTPPPCPFGGLCYRLDPPHFVEQSHPPDHPMAIHGLRAAASSAATGAAHSSAASAKSGWVLLPDDDDTPMRSDDARVVPAAAAPVAVSHRPPPPPFSRPRSAAAGEDDFLEDDEDEDEDDVIDLTSPAPPKATTLASATDASRKPPLHPSSSSSSSSVAPGAAAVAPLFTSSGLAAASAASTAPAAAAASAAAAAPPAAKRARTAAATEKTYKPKLHSSAYALLRGLLDASVAGLGALSKAQLLHEAMRYFKKGSADPDDGGAAAAASPAAAAAANGVSESDLKTSLWSGMSNLVARDLVDKSLTPVTYALTEAGRACIMQFAPAPPRSLPAPSPSPDLSLSSSSPDPHSSPVPSAAASVNAAPARSPSASPPPLPLPFGSPAPPSMRRIFCPSSDFDVVLLIDQRERSGRKDAAFMVEKLSKQGLVCEARSLSVGDFMFVARHRSSSQQSHQPSSSSASSSPGVPPAEVVLDCLVERKRVSDLVSSIRDGRYHEQRARLKKTQLRRILYLIEGPVTQEAVHGLPLATVESVLTSMNGVHGLLVQHTPTIDATITFLASLHHLVSQEVRSAGVPVVLPEATVAALVEARTPPTLTAQHLPLPSLHDLAGVVPSSLLGSGESLVSFSARLHKSANLLAAELFGTQLRQIRGVSAGLARSVLARYPSCRALCDAYEAGGSQEAEEELLAALDRGKHHQRPMGKAMSLKIRTFFRSRDGEA